jgi:hypothetical protein
VRSTPRLLSLLLLAAVAGPGVAAAQERAAAVLAIEDSTYPGYEVTERIGALLYTPFLQAGPYKRIVRVLGEHDETPRLAAAIRDVAASADVVDVFCSIHTTQRTAAELQRLLPPAVRAKLRLVYSTACYGAEAERAAWESVRPRTVITHQGLNNPMIALPYILSRWLAGAPIGQAAAEGYRETQVATALVGSLVGPTGSALGGYVSDDMFDTSGCRPVISGDANLTITTGLRGHRPNVPEALVYSRARGGPIGLLLRALNGASLTPADAGSLLDRTYARSIIPPEALDKLQRIGAGRARSLFGSGEGQLELSLSQVVTVAIPDLSMGLKLRVARDVSIRPGRVDVVSRRIQLSASGLSLTRGLIRINLRGVTLEPGPNGQGTRIRATAGLWGFIPVWKTFRFEGAVTPPPADGPVLEPMPKTPGMIDALTARRDRPVAVFAPAR